MKIFELTNATIARGAETVLRDFSWTMHEGEVWAITGSNGSGKTTLAETLLARHSLGAGAMEWPLFDRLRKAGRKIDYPSQVVSHVTFREDSRLFSYAGRYYQQRFEFADSDTPLSLEQYLRTNTHATSSDFDYYCNRFGIAGLLQQPFMTLSNGQTRRARLTRAILTKPKLLILDDPFIGLDSNARGELTALLHSLANDGMRLILICREELVPSWVTHTLALSSRTQLSAVPPEFSVVPDPRSSQEPVIELRDVTVNHAGYTILDRVSWTVNRGERWAVLGPNGSGKSTLLSLLCGDHPQAYANTVRLFGRQRGTGETIWDVKRNVGLLSPEFHLYFRESLSVERTIATGFWDTVADTHATAPNQESRVRELVCALGIAHLAGRSYKTLSTGEQRLVLLARALVKRPQLLILDEPFQAMDSTATTRVRVWLERELGADQTLLFVTHDLSELPRTVNRTLQLDRGRVQSLG